MSTYHIYQGKHKETLQVFIPVKNISLEKADQYLQSISQTLMQKMPKNWKCLPSSTLPQAYNIVTLPYQRFEG